MRWAGARCPTGRRIVRVTLGVFGTPVTIAPRKQNDRTDVQPTFQSSLSEWPGAEVTALLAVGYGPIMDGMLRAKGVA